MRVVQATINMVKGQIIPNIHPDEKLSNAFLEIPRSLFVPEHFENACYIDNHLKFNNERYLMSSLILAKTIQAANIKEDETVLEIAPLTGYSTIILSKLCKNVYALENDAESRELAEKNRIKLGAMNAHIFSGDYLNGFKTKAPYDVIFIHGAVEKICDEYFAQLNNGGRIVTFIIQDKNQTSVDGNLLACLTIFCKDNDAISKQELYTVNIFPLTDLHICDNVEIFDSLQ